MAAASPLPRELIKWLQSLDLSFCVKNPKRDFSNGYLVAEILSRYFPKDVSMTTFENGTRLAAKVDNWDQVQKLLKRKSIAISKQEIEPVIHCAAGAAVAFALHLYGALTKRAVKHFTPQAMSPDVPAFMRDTAARRLKDTEIARIEDNVERTIRAIDVLGSYHQERRAQKATEAPLLIRQERHMRVGLHGTDAARASKDEVADSVHVEELKVKSLATNMPQLRGGQQQASEQPRARSATGRSRLLKAVCNPGASLGAIAAMPQPAMFVKPAAEIMRPLVLSILQESEVMSKAVDSKKDIFAAFMEQCREGVLEAATRDPSGRAAVPLEEHVREVEETSARVFETLASRAQLLVDTLTKSTPEFWKVWSTFYPALTDFSESSPIFESAVFLFKRLGELMREADPNLTQQLITEVGLPSLVKELSRSPEKREALCEIIYSYTQEDALNHLLVLRALKDKVGDSLPVYVSCLSCLVAVDAQLGLLDEHMLDLYIYYALIAIQSPQPRTRVAGISILSTVTMGSSQQHNVVALLPTFAALAHDEWWEVQAQLLLLSAHLLGMLSAAEREEGLQGDDDDTSAVTGSRFGDQPRSEAGAAMDNAAEVLLDIIGRLFVVGNSKNVLQVGLSALVTLLPEYLTLLPMFVTVLLEQPPALRQRLLQPPEAGQAAGAASTVGRLTYVMGNASRMYEEKCISALWPHLDVAKTLTRQLDASSLEHLELEHMEVLRASLPEEFLEEDAEEWLGIFEKVKQYLFVALVDPGLHHLSTQIVRRFWLSEVDFIATRSIETSKKTLLQALRLLYGSVPRSCIDEAVMLQFLRDLWSQGGNVQSEVASIIGSFKETNPAEYKASRLNAVLS